MTKIIFLEGPAYAGKTTFLEGLDSEKYLKLPEASEFLGGDKNFPSAPTDLRSMIYCSHFFAVMEQLRLNKAEKNPSNKIVVADRYTSVSSLLFYNLRYQNGSIPESDYVSGMIESCKIFSSTPFPEMISEFHFLLFDINSKSEFMKRLPRGTRNKDFNSWENFRKIFKTYTQILSPNFTPVVDQSADIGAVSKQKASPASSLYGLFDPQIYFELSGLDLKVGKTSSDLQSSLATKEVLDIKERVVNLISNSGSTA